MHVISASFIDCPIATHCVSSPKIFKKLRTTGMFGKSFVLVWALWAILPVLPCSAQDWIRTGTGLGVEKVRLAASDFKASTQDAKNATC